MVRVLSVSDAVALGSIVRAAWNKQLVAWVNPDSPDGHTWGVARCIGDLYGNPVGDAATDVRDCYLRVTLSTGVDSFVLVSDAIRKAHRATFVTNYSQHPEAHPPGFWCKQCPPMPPGVSLDTVQWWVPPVSGKG